MNFDVCFDFWLAKKVNDLLKSGFTFKQVVKMMQLLYNDICDCIEDEILLKMIKDKIETTLSLFYMVEEKDE